MSKARTLADFISDGSEFADGTISVAEVSGAAPLASPSFTGSIVMDGTVTHDSSNGTQPFYITRQGATDQTGRLYTDDSTFVFDSIQDEASGAAFLFRSTNSSVTNQNVLELNPAGVFVNQDGADQDFRVESANSSHMLFVDASTDRVAIGKNVTPLTTLHVATDVNGEAEIRLGRSTYAENYLNFGFEGGTSVATSNGVTGVQGSFRIDTDDSSGTPVQRAFFGTAIVFNDGGIDQDFRVESDANTHALFLDAANNVVGIGDSSSLSAGVRLHVNKNDLTTYGTDGVALQNDVPVKIQNINTSVNNIMSGIHIRSGTWDGGIIGVPTGNGSNNNGFLALISESQEGVRFYNDAANGGTVFNEHGVNRDFRVESDGNANMLKVDAGENAVGIGVAPGSSYRTLTIEGANEQSNLHIHGENAGIYIGTSYTGGFTNNAAIARAQNGSYHISGSAVGDLCIAAERQKDLLFGGTDSASGSNFSYVRIKAGGTFNVYRHAVFNEDSGDYDFRIESNNNANMLKVDAGEDKVLIGAGTNAGVGGAQLQVGGFGVRGSMGVTTGTNTGIPINQGSSGGTALIIASRNYDSGTGTQSQVAMIQFYFNGSYTPALTHISGTNFITVGKTGSSGSETMTLSNTSGGNCTVTILMST